MSVRKKLKKKKVNMLSILPKPVGGDGSGRNHLSLHQHPQLSSSPPSPSNLLLCDNTVPPPPPPTREGKTDRRKGRGHRRNRHFHHHRGGYPERSSFVSSRFRRYVMTPVEDIDICRRHSEVRGRRVPPPPPGFSRPPFVPDGSFCGGGGGGSASSCSSPIRPSAPYVRRHVHSTNETQCGPTHRGGRGGGSGGNATTTPKASKQQPPRKGPGIIFAYTSLIFWFGLIFFAVSRPYFDLQAAEIARRDGLRDGNVRHLESIERLHLRLSRNSNIPPEKNAMKSMEFIVAVYGGIIEKMQTNHNCILIAWLVVYVPFFAYSWKKDFVERITGQTEDIISTAFLVCAAFVIGGWAMWLASCENVEKATEKEILLHGCTPNMFD